MTLDPDTWATHALNRAINDALARRESRRMREHAAGEAAAMAIEAFLRWCCA